MFLSVATFLKVWEKEAKSTQRILGALTEDSLNQLVTAQDRTLGRIVWHIVTTIPEMMGRTGLMLEGINEDAPLPNTTEEILHSYEEVSHSLETAIRHQWNDQSLLEKKDMYGETWTNGHTLSALIDHQIHHRGQITVLMRQAGLKVPGIYGPSREDWRQIGMEPPRI